MCTQHPSKRFIDIYTQYNEYQHCLDRHFFCFTTDHVRCKQCTYVHTVTGTGDAWAHYVEAQKKVKERALAFVAQHKVFVEKHKRCMLIHLKYTRFETLFLEDASALCASCRTIYGFT